MLGQKPESLVDSFLLSAMKAIGTFLKVKNVEALQKDLKNDMVNAELSTRPCWLTLRCGSWLSPASGASSRRYHGGWRCLKRCDFHWWNLPRKNFFGWKWCRRQKVRPSSIKHLCWIPAWTKCSANFRVVSFAAWTFLWYMTNKFIEIIVVEKTTTTFRLCFKGLLNIMNWTNVEKYRTSLKKSV